MAEQNGGVYEVALAAADTGGGVVGLANPEGVDLIVVELILDVTTKSTGACTLDAGITATSITTLSDTLIDGVDVGTATGVFNNTDNKGTNGFKTRKWPAASFLTVSKASGAAAGLVGSAYIRWIRP